MPNMDNNIEDDNKIRVIGETQWLKTEDIISIDDNNEAHPVTAEDTTIINDSDKADPLATEDIINTPDNVQTHVTNLRNNHPHLTIGPTTKEANDKAVSTSSLARCPNRLLALKPNNNNQNHHALNGLRATENHAHLDQERQHQTTTYANTYACLTKDGKYSRTHCHGRSQSPINWGRNRK
jgi:hypothetical protein